MKLCSVDKLKGNEVLARAIMTSELRVLLYEDTILRPEYIEKIKELGIKEVYIKDQDPVHAQEVVLLRSETERFFILDIKSDASSLAFNNSSRAYSFALSISSFC